MIKDGILDWGYLESRKLRFVKEDINGIEIKVIVIVRVWFMNYYVYYVYRNGDFLFVYIVFECKFVYIGFWFY